MRAAPKTKPAAPKTPRPKAAPKAPAAAKPKHDPAATPPEEPAVPHVEEGEAAALANRNRDETYRLNPEHELKNGAPGTIRRADGPYEGHITPTPAGLIRMTHPEGAVSDGFQTDESGAILVPHSQVEALKSHGFIVDHLPAE